MEQIRCVDCKFFEPDPSSLRTGKCLHEEPWDGDATQFSRDEHQCANFDSHGGSRHLSPEDVEKFKKSTYY